MTFQEYLIYVKVIVRFLIVFVCNGLLLQNAGCSNQFGALYDIFYYFFLG
jgi:hypothetical protein